MTRMRGDRTPAWRALQSLYASNGAKLDLRRQFGQDPGHFEAFSQNAPHLFADLSKNLIDREIERQLFVLARQCGVEEHMDAMFRGDVINTSEKHAVKHFLLRTPLPAGAGTDDPDLRAVRETLDAMLAYAEVNGQHAYFQMLNQGNDVVPVEFVELGKVLAKDLEPRLHSGDASGLGRSTAGLLHRLHTAP